MQHDHVPKKCNFDYIPNINALSLMVSDNRIFHVFLYISLCKTCDAFGLAIICPRGII